MSLRSKRLIILSDSETKDLFGAPRLTTEEKRFYFTMNDLELEVCHSFRMRNNRINFVLLLGYFKIKPVILNSSYKEIKEDLRLIAEDCYPSQHLRMTQVNRDQKTRTYQRILQVLNYRNIGAENETNLIEHIAKTAITCIDARYLFDDCIDYLAKHCFAIPKYTLLQRWVSNAIQLEHNRIGSILSESIPVSLSEAINNILHGHSSVSVNEIRKSAKNFTAIELEKELAIHRCITPLMDDIDNVIEQLGLSFKNLQHYASLVDYYTITKLRRFSKNNQRLFLMCNLHVRVREVIEHLADGFVYHCRKLQEGAKDYAKEAAYREWRDAAANVSKAADLLHLFIVKNRLLQ